MADKPSRHLQVTTADDVLLLRVIEPQFHGDVLAEDIRAEMQQAVGASNLKKIVIDLEPVKYISSAAFRPLLSLRRKLQENGGQMVLCNLAPLVLEVFQLLRLISTSRSYPATFEVQPDVPAALVFLKNPGPAS